MTDAVQVKLIGARDIVAAFKDLREYVAKTAVRRAVRESAKLMLALVQTLVRVRTGKLRDNITIRVRRTAETVRARVVVNTRGKADDPKNAFYWRFLEKGWRTTRGTVLRFPFVETAFEARKQQSAQQVIDEMDKAIKRAERKAAKAGRR